MNKFEILQFQIQRFYKSNKFTSSNHLNIETKTNKYDSKIKSLTDRNRKNLPQLIQKSSTCESEEKDNYRKSLVCEFPPINLKVMNPICSDSEGFKNQNIDSPSRQQKRKIQGVSLPRMPKKAVRSQINRYRKFVQKILLKNDIKMRDDEMGKIGNGQKCKVRLGRQQIYKREDWRRSNYWSKIMISQISVKQDEQVDLFGEVDDECFF